MPRLEDPKRETAAWALAQDSNQAAAGRRASVDRATIARWLKDDEFSARVDELKIQLLTPDDPDDLADVAERGLARMIPLAEAVIEASLKGEHYNGKLVTTQQHANALKTIELARKFEPKETGSDGTPSLADLIANADAARVAG